MALDSSSIVRFPGDSVAYMIPNWDELTELTFQVALQMREDSQRFPVMVTLAKGGLPLARVLADFMQIPVIMSLGIQFYTGIGTRLSTPEIYQDISPLETLRGQSVILFDDVADTGESLQFAGNYLKASGVQTVTTATLYYKEKSSVIPDYYGQLSNDWIVFPFEVIETTRYLSARWRTEGVSQAEEQQRFLQLGLKEHWLQILEQTTL